MVWLSCLRCFMTPDGRVRVMTRVMEREGPSLHTNSGNGVTSLFPVLSLIFSTRPALAIRVVATVQRM